MPRAFAWLMRTFEYRGFDFEGHARKGLVEALDIKEARDTLARDGVLVRKIGPVEGDARERDRGRHDFSAETRVVVYRELGSLIRSGLPLVKALDILIDSPELDSCSKVLAGVRDRIREGGGVAEALTGVSKSVSMFESGLIGVGERSGALGDMLDRLATYLEQQEQLRDKVNAAMVYPVTVVIVAIAVMLGVFLFVLPQANRMLMEMDIPVPAVTTFMMGLGRVVLASIGPVLVLCLAAYMHTRRRLARDDAFRMRFDRRLFRMPMVGQGYTIATNLRFARALSCLLHGGVSLVEGTEMAGRATGSAWVAHLVDVEVESVRHGGSLADALKRVPPLSMSLPGWIRAGEASGEMEQLLEKIADRYQHKWERFVSRSLSLLEPALVLVLGVFVLLVALSVLTPIMAGYRALQ